MKSNYEQFLRDKIVLAPQGGFDVTDDEVNPILKAHQRQLVRWMVRGGKRACFAAFGLGKSVIQLECVRITAAKCAGRGLIVIPLGVRQEFLRDAVMLGIKAKFIRRADEIDGDDTIYLTNYETVRDGKLDPQLFDVVSLDEASILRGFGGTKTFREFMAVLAGDDRRDVHERRRGEGVRYRFVATATPSPNEYIELLAYAAFLGVMDIGQAKTRFFKRDSTKADKLTLHAHKEREFWLWVGSWAIFLQRPSDIGCSDDGYTMPGLDVHWHELPADHSAAGHDMSGQSLMFKEEAIGVIEASREKRGSLAARVAKLMEIITADAANRGPDSSLHQMVIWCDLNDEQIAIEKALAAAGISVSSLTGSQDLDERDALMQAWRDRQTAAFVSKPSMYGAGVNMQQCHDMYFVGIGFKAQDLLQAIHRIHRFQQQHRCSVHLIHTESEREVRRTLEAKWQQHNEMVGKMTAIIKEFGLSDAGKAEQLTRKLGVERVEVSGRNFRCINNDTVVETAAMPSDSVHLIVTSIPFATQYEYSPNYADFGHTDNNEHFFAQMDFLTQDLLRVLQPGRLAAIHVKDRIVPGGMTGLGFQTVYPFHAQCIAHFTKHGFGYMGMKTIVTDVVRENNQTYRLGWTEQCKDGTKMGVGMPEYLLIFRKPPTDNSDSYADTPVVKSKQAYTRSRWQVDAHAFARSSGDRLLTHDEAANLPHDQIFQMFKRHSLENVYSFEHHVRTAEAIDEAGRLPVTFMLLQPQSWSDEVWTDIARMLTLNSTQSSKGKEMHLCPLQFDIVDRAIEQWSNPGETVFDPFGGLMTVPYRAVLKGRRGIGVELAPGYFADGAAYCKAAENQMSMPSLFDALEREAA